MRNQSCFGDGREQTLLRMAATHILPSLLLLFSLQTAAARRTVRGCDGDSVQLSCPQDQTVNIIRANYGRLSQDICSDQSDWQTVQSWSTRCIQPRTLREVSSRCSSDGASHCSLEVSSQVFGDPCPDTPKYLEVVYTCQRREKVTQPPMLPPWLLSLEAMADIINKKSSTTTTSTTSTTSTSSPTDVVVESNEIPPVEPSPLIRQPSREFLSYLQRVKERPNQNTISLMLNNPRESVVNQETFLDRDVIAAIVIAILATTLLMVAVIIILCCKSRSKNSPQEPDLETSSSTYLSYGVGRTEGILPGPSHLPFRVKCGQTGETYEYAEFNYKNGNTRNCRQYDIKR